MLGDDLARKMLETATLRSQKNPRRLKKEKQQQQQQQQQQGDTATSPPEAAPNSNRPRPSRGPSYIPAALFADALHEMFGVEGSSFELDLSLITDESLRTRLEKLADKVGNDATELRREVETWFDDTMDRVSGWYKRRSQAILLGVGLLIAAAANLSAVSVGERLWNDSSLRAVVTAEATQAVQSATTTTTATTTEPTTTRRTEAAAAPTSSVPASATTVATTPASVAASVVGPLQRADQEYRTIHQLGLPAGWGDDNRPHGATWFAAIFGWVITAFAVSLGAPFWFDVLNKAVNLRGAGPPPDPTTPPASTPPAGATTPGPSSPPAPPAPGVADVAPAAVVPAPAEPVAPPSAPGIADPLPIGQRSLVIASALDLGDGRYESLYRALQHAGPAIVRNTLDGSYARANALIGDELTEQALVDALAAAASTSLAVDLILMVHGEPDRLVLSDGHGAASDVSIFDLAAKLAGNEQLAGRLRLCYSTACFGFSHAQALLGAGFRAVIGARGVNANSATELPLLLRAWASGEHIGDALERADDPVLRDIADALARLAGFDEVDSMKMLLGDRTLTIDAPPHA